MHCDISRPFVLFRLYLGQVLFVFQVAQGDWNHANNRESIRSDSLVSCPLDSLVYHRCFRGASFDVFMLQMTVRDRYYYSSVTVDPFDSNLDNGTSSRTAIASLCCPIDYFRSARATIFNLKECLEFEPTV